MYFINTNWKHLQLLTVTFITLETHGTDPGSGTAPRLTCGQDTAAGSHGATQPHTRGAEPAELPRCPSPAGHGSSHAPRSPRLLPSWAQHPSTPGHTGHSRAQPGTAGACHLSTTSRGTFAALGALRLRGCSHGSAGHKPEALCLASFSRLLLQDTPEQWPCHGAHGAHGPRGTAGQTELGLGPEVAVEPCPGSRVGLSSRHPRAFPGDGCLRSALSTGDGDSWDPLQILLLVLLRSTQGLGLAPATAAGLLLQGSRAPKAQTWAQGIRMVLLSWQGGRAEGLLPW